MTPAGSTATLPRFVVLALGSSLGLYVIASLTTMAGMEIFGWLTAALTLSALVSARIQRLSAISFDLSLDRLDLSLFALASAIVMSALFAEPENADRVFVAGTSRFVALYFFVRVAMQLTWSESVQSKFLIGIVFLIGAIGLYAVFQNQTGIDLIRGHRNPIQQELLGGALTYRARGMWDHPVRFGHSMALVLCLPLSVLLVSVQRSTDAQTGDQGSSTANSRSRFALLMSASVFSLAAGTLGLLSSQTRGAWIGFAAAVVVSALLASRRFLLPSLAALGVGGLAVSPFIPGLSGRLFSILSPTSDNSGSARVDMWRANLEMFREHPFLGVGYGLNEDLILIYYKKLGIDQWDAGHAHNNFIQFLSGTGLVGFAAYLSFSAIALLMTLRLWRTAQSRRAFLPSVFALFALGAQAVMHVGGLTECSFKSAQITHQYFIAIAIAMAWLRRLQWKS